MSLRIGDPRGYRPAYPVYPPDDFDASLEFRLFRDNISVILANAPAILAVSDYFFCPLYFAYCTAGTYWGAWLDCALRVGHLLIAWRHGILAEECTKCGGKRLVTAFGGNLKYEATWSNGLCIQCLEYGRTVSPRETTTKRIDIVRRIVQRSPEDIEEYQQFAGYRFSWAGDGLSATTKTRIVARRLYDPVPFDVLIHELQENCLRRGYPPVIGSSQGQLKCNFANQQRLRDLGTGLTIVAETADDS